MRRRKIKNLWVALVQVDEPPYQMLAPPPLCYAREDAFLVWPSKAEADRGIKSLIEIGFCSHGTAIRLVDYFKGEVRDG